MDANTWPISLGTSHTGIQTLLKLNVKVTVASLDSNLIKTPGQVNFSLPRKTTNSCKEELLDIEVTK